MKVGDLVKYLRDTGIVLEVDGEKNLLDGHTQGQALVLWQDGKTQWVASVMCVVVNESW
jgi:hypothetical protein